MTITLDPAFFVEQYKGLVLPESARSQWLADALAHLVARRPKDLRRHVQRILLHQVQGQGEALYAALLDMFIALGASGYALRERLSVASESLLSSEQRNFLASHLVTGVLAGDTHPIAPRSRLSIGATGNFDFITRNSKQSLDTRPVITQALDYITFGQLDSAQQILEQALLTNPNDDEICLELSQLYQHTRNIDALNHLLAKLGSQAPVKLREIASLLASAGR